MAYHQQPAAYYPEPSSPGASPYYHQQPLQHQQHHHHQRQEIQEQISRHHDLERGLDRMEQRSHQQVPSLAQVVMQECHEAKIRRQNRQIAISAGVTIGLIVLVIWFVASR